MIGPIQVSYTIELIITVSDKAVSSSHYHTCIVDIKARDKFTVTTVVMNLSWPVTSFGC
jgi:hypothetical protein